MIGARNQIKGIRSIWVYSNLPISATRPLACQRLAMVALHWRSNSAKALINRENFTGLASVPAWTRRGHWPAARCCLSCQFSWLSNWRSRKDLAKRRLRQLRTTKENNTGLGWHYVWSFIELSASKLYCRANRNRRYVFILLQIDNNSNDIRWSACDRS